MMENISGNFNTSAIECRVVYDFLNTLSIDTTSCLIEKFGTSKNGEDTNAKGAGDVYVKFADKTFLLFEIKEESEERISKYNQLGIDFISAFQFKPNSNGRKGLYNPNEYDSFIEKVDVFSSDFKWG